MNSGRVAWHPVRYYLRIPAPVRVLSIGVLINRAGGFVTAFLALILAIRDVSAPRIGVALAATAAFTIAGAWLGGALVARLGSRRVIAASMTGSALFTAALIPMTPYPVTVGIACLIALCNRAYIPASTTLIGRLSSPEQRLPMYSFFQLSYNVGAAIGSAAAGYLLTHSLTVLLAIDAATSACFVLAALRIPDDPQRPRRGTQAGDGHAPDKIRHDRRYLMFCAGATLVALAYTQHTGPLPLAFRSHHYSLELLGYLFSANAIAVILFQLPLSYQSRRWPVRVPLALGAVLIGGGYALLLAGFSVPLLAASVALWTAGELVYAPAPPTVATLMSNPRTHGSYQGALDVARSTGQAFGPSLGVFAYSAGTSIPWLASGVLGAAAACLFLAAVRPRGSETAGLGSREPVESLRPGESGA
jgi:MFS family permease